jgi:thiopurine S-methyltransferase
MEPSFWHERWATGQIGFHLSAPHPLLIKHDGLLGAGSRVLVPLCGKAEDLAWLAAHGHSVVGVELSELAVRAFFDEHELSVTESGRGPFKRFAAGEIEVLCGDFFELRREHTCDAHGRAVNALYDRAALIALPEPMRERYAKHVAGLLPGAAGGLLITLEYGASNSSGPPFSVASDEVKALYEPQIEVRELERSDILDSEPRFRERGMSALYEVAYALKTSP